MGIFYAYSLLYKELGYRAIINHKNRWNIRAFDAVPTTWDETRVLVAEIGEIGVVARRKGEDWYIGGINGKNARILAIDFSFLKEGIQYKAKLYTDDETIKTRTRVKIETLELDKQSTLKLNIKSNNGFAMQLVPQS